MSKEGAEHPHSGVPLFTTAGEEQPSRSDQLLEYQTEHPKLWFSLCDAVRHDTQRSILTAIQDGMGSCTYDEIERYASVQRRTIRKHVKKLEENGIVERIDSRSYAISYVNFEVEVLASHALDCYFG
jgi:predicted transcriptional regulator